MSETPRTDAARQDEHDPYMAVASECSKMEKELNAANQRIKRLEEAGDAVESDKQALKKILSDIGAVGSMGLGSTVKWVQAKEAKL